MNIEVILTLLTGHFFADFVFQSHWMATNKCKNFNALFSHVLVYSAAMIPIVFVIFGYLTGSLNGTISYMLLNGFLHMVTDFITSRSTSFLWKKENTHMFFVVVGFDQLIHQATLLTTLYFWIN
jgi:hypothetical protein